jgi:hypothetical protein
VQAPAVTTVSEGSSSSTGSKSSSSGGSGDGNIGVIAGAAAGGVVLIGGIVALVLCLRMKKQPAGNSTSRLAPNPAARMSRYHPNYMFDEARLVATPPAATYDRNLMDVGVGGGVSAGGSAGVSAGEEVVSPMFNSLPTNPAADPVIDLSGLMDDVDGQSSDNFSMRLDDVLLNMTHGYADPSEGTSTDVVAVRDEQAVVDSLISKNLGHVMDDEIPSAAVLNEDDGDPEHRHCHVFKKAREYF